MKRNQPGLRILLFLHVSWSHFMYLFAGLLSHRERPRCWYVIIKPTAMGNQALSLAPGSAWRAVSICLPSWTRSWQIRLNAHCHKQGPEKMFGSSWTTCISLGGKGSSRIKSLCGWDPALRATLGPCTAREHNQHCPSYNHKTTTLMFAVHMLSGLMCLQEDLSGWEMISQTLCPLLAWIIAKRKPVLGKILASYNLDEYSLFKKAG